MNIKRSACSFFTPFFPTPSLICIIMMYQRNLVTFYLRARLVTAMLATSFRRLFFSHRLADRFPCNCNWWYCSAVICNTFQVIDFSRGARSLHKSYNLWMWRTGCAQRAMWKRRLSYTAPLRSPIYRWVAESREVGRLQQYFRPLKARKERE